MSREPRRYRVWAGCPGGVPEDVTRCIESVRDKGRSPLSSQCSKKRRPGSDYCGTHDPVNVKARRDKAQAKYEAQLEASPHRVIARLRASLAAAEAKLADERKHATQVATVLCDRIHANTIYIGAVAGLNDFHEDATACISHNMEAINATRDLAGCDRSHERWEVEAQARLREIIAESERRAREACAEADADSAARRQEASDERP